MITAKLLVGISCAELPSRLRQATDLPELVGALPEVCSMQTDPWLGDVGESHTPKWLDAGSRRFAGWTVPGVQAEDLAHSHYRQYRQGWRVPARRFPQSDLPGI